MHTLAFVTTGNFALDCLLVVAAFGAVCLLLVSGDLVAKRVINLYNYFASRGHRLGRLSRKNFGGRGKRARPARSASVRPFRRTSSSYAKRTSSSPRRRRARA